MATSNSKLSNSCNLLVPCMALLLLAPNSAEAAVACDKVYSDLYPCLSYITSGRALSTSCCNGIQSLSTSATTTTDRQSICNCIQSATSSISLTSYNLRLANSLPYRCGVRVPYQFIPRTNCNMIP